MEDQDDSSLEKIIEEEETSKVRIKRSTASTEYDNEDDSIDMETSVMDDSLPELGPRPSLSAETFIVSEDRKNGANRMRRWSASAQQHGSPRGSWIPEPMDVRPVRSRSDSQIKEYGPVRKWAVDYNNRNYIRSLCHKHTGNFRKTMWGRTYDWDVDYDNNCYVRSLIRIPKGRHRQIKEVPRKTVPDNDILADSRGWQFEYGHDFPQVEEDVPYTPQERVVARGAYRCYGVTRSQSDTFLNVDTEREPFEEFREEEFKYGREFLQDDMPLMILGKDRRTLRGGYRFYDVDRSKCDQCTRQNDIDGYDGEYENIPDIQQGRKFKRTILKKTLQYPKKLTEAQFGTALSFVPGEGGEEFLEGTSTTLPSLRHKKMGVRNAFKKPKVAEPGIRREDMWKRPDEIQHSRPPPLREEALRRASEKADNLRRASMRIDQEEEYYPERNHRDSYRAQEARRLSRIKKPRGELAFQPNVSFEYENVRQPIKSLVRTPQSRRSFKNEKRESIVEDDELERRRSIQRRRLSFRDEDSYQKRGGMEDELGRRISDQRRRSSFRDEHSFQNRGMMEDEPDRRISQRRRSSIRDEDSFQKRGMMEDEHDRGIIGQRRRSSVRDEDSIQIRGMMEDEPDRRISQRRRSSIRDEDSIQKREMMEEERERRMSSQMRRSSIRDEEPYKARMDDERVRRISDQIRKPVRRSEDFYQAHERNGSENRRSFTTSTPLMERRTTDNTMGRRISPIKEHPRMSHDPHQARLYDDTVRRISDQVRRSSRGSKDLRVYQVEDSDEEEDEETFTSTAVLGRRQTDEAMEGRKSSLKAHPRMVYHQGDESDEGENDTFTSTAVLGRRPTDEGMERRRSSLKDHPIMVYPQGDESDEDEETFTSTAVLGRRPTDNAMERRRSSQKEQPRMSYVRHQPHKEQPRMSFDYHQQQKEHPRMVHQDDAPDEEDEQTYTSTASWGNPRQSRQASRNSGQVYSSMASRKGDRSSKPVGSKKYIVSESEESCLRTRSKGRLETIVSEEKSVRKRDRIVHKKSNRSIGSRDKRYDANDGLERQVAQDNRNSSRYEDRAYAPEHAGGQSEDRWKRLRKTYLNKENELEKRSNGSAYVRNQPKLSYKENTRSNYSGREMNKKQLVSHKKEIPSSNGDDLLNEFRKHRHHPKDYGEYAEDGYEKFLDENGSEVYEKVKKKSSKIFHRRS